MVTLLDILEIPAKESFEKEYLITYSDNSLKPRSGGSQETEALKFPIIENWNMSGAAGRVLIRTISEFAAFPAEFTVKITTYLIEPIASGFEQSNDPSGA